LTPAFSTNRTVREYTEEHYLSAAEAYCQRAAEHGQVAAGIVEWRRRLNEAWAHIRFGKLGVEQREGMHLFEVQVYLDDLDAEAVRVELYADPISNTEVPVRQTMQRGHALFGSVGGYTYTASVPATRPVWHFTPRVVPFKTGAFVPLEADQILWQR
jgi:starch phosphorylase